MSALYSYIFIRKDLSPAQQIVQASHAAMEMGYKHTPTPSPTHIVLIGMETQEALVHTADYLTSHNIPHEMFHEPDYDTGFTAIATRPITGSQRKLFKRYSLYTPGASPC